MAANTPLNYASNDSQYSTWSAAANAPVSSTTTTSNLVAKNYYAYTKAYITDASGPQNGTGKGVQIKVLVWFANPNREARTIRCEVCVYMRRTDGYTTQSPLTLNCYVGNRKSNYYAQPTISNSWIIIHIMRNTFNYDDNGNLQIRFQMSGSNKAGSIKSINNASFLFSAPNIGKKNVKSTASFTNSEIAAGDKLLINLTKSSGTTHTVKYSFAGLSGTLIEKSTATSTSWQTTVDMCSNFTGDYNYGTIEVLTYQGDTYLGSNKYTFKVSVPANIQLVPKIESVIDTKGYNNDSNKDMKTFLRGYSVLKVKVSVDRSQSQNASFVKGIIKFGNWETIEFTDSSEKEITMTKPIPTTNYGYTDNITFTTLDSRGRTADTSVSIRTKMYQAPRIDILTVTRGEYDGNTFTQAEDGHYAAIHYLINSEDMKYGVKGKFQVKIQYRKTTESDYTDILYNINQNPEYGNSYSISDRIYHEFDQDFSFIIKVIASDGTKSSYREFHLPAAFNIVEINETGKGISIGTVSTENKFVVNMPTVFKQNVYNNDGGVAITSDIRKKDNVKKMNEEIDIDSLIKFYNDVNPISFRYKDNSELKHFGFSAQEIQNKLSENCVDKVDDYAIVEQVIEKSKIKGKDVIDEFLTLRYEEITPLNFMMIKYILQELLNINNRLKELIDNGEDSKSNK